MKEFQKGTLKVKIFDTRVLMGEGAAEEIGQKIRELLKDQETVNIVFAAAPSQNEFLASFVKKPVEWSRINAFHMDEYVGLDKNAPQLFANYLKSNLFDKVKFKEVHYINDVTGRPDQKCKKYAGLLEKYPTDIVILGIGENTHLAFNDPHVASFNDMEAVKVVDLDDKNRHQQVDPNDPVCFKKLEDVPTHAITLTIPTLFKAKYAYAIVPGKNKTEAIYHTINEPIKERFPSTILRMHPHAVLFVDKDSAIKL